MKHYAGLDVSIKGKRCLDHIGLRFDAGRFPHVMWQAGLQ